MRVGLVVTGGVDRSGRERVVPALLALIEAMARRHEIHIFALRHYRSPCSYTLLGAAVHDLGRVDGVRGLGRLRQARRLLNAIRRIGRFDVLHAYWAVPAGVVATRVARGLSIPSIVTFDSGEFVSLPDIRYGLQRRWIDRRAVAETIRSATRMTVCTDYMARLANAHGATIERVPIGIDSRHFRHVERPEGPPWRLLHVGSLNRVKDHETLLHAMARVISTTPAVHLDIVGEDTLGGRVQQVCRALGLEAHVSFHGFQPTDVLASFYARAHLHVVSSRHEAAGVVCLEAACAGVPTVGTAVGYVADWAAAHQSVAVPVGDSDALAAAILALLGNRDTRTRIAEAARSWTLEHWADWTARRFEEIYAEAGTRHGT